MTRVEGLSAGGYGLLEVKKLPTLCETMGLGIDKCSIDATLWRSVFEGDDRFSKEVEKMKQLTLAFN